MNIKNASYCTPQRDGHTYEGWHERSLKCLTQAQAERIAAVYHKQAFYCEYGNCWHVGG